MRRRDIWYVVGLVVVAALLLANLLQPVQISAFTLPDEGELAFPPNVAIAGDSESAWVLLHNRVYYVTLRPRGEVENRTITVIDDEDLR